MNSLFCVLLSEDLQTASDFYVRFFGFKIVFQADWYVQLHYIRLNAPPLELAFMLPNMVMVPESVRTSSSSNTGVILTLDFDDVDAIYAKLIANKAVKQFALEPTNELWGQRHFMFQDPTGLIVDVVQAIAPSAEYEGAYSGNEDKPCA